MAGLGLGPADFELFEIDDPEERAAAVDATLQPRLHTVAAQCLPGLSRVTGRALHLHDVKVPRRRGQGPEEAFVAFSDSPKAWRGLPYLAVAVTREHLHARVGVKGESPRRAAMRDALTRESGNLAKKGKPFRKLRVFDGWNYEDLPELAPAHSQAFWLEVAEAVGPGGDGLDAGIVFTAAEARSLSMGDLLGVFRDLSPLYKVLCNAG
jgi:uncharacterized protein DUF1054